VLPSVVVSRRRLPSDLLSPGDGLRILFAVADREISQTVSAVLAQAFPESHVERVDSMEGFHRALKRLAPDVAIVDDALDELDVPTALMLLQEAHSPAPLIVVARELQEESMVEGLRAGAEDFVSLGQVNRLRDALEKALSIRRPLRRLSPRQLDVLRLIAAGHTTPGIASRLERSPKTIETHRSEIMKRLGIHDVVGLVRYAIRVGLLPPEAQPR
jgi:DNA-binding NarL/FixJ family response regulator